MHVYYHDSGYMSDMRTVVARASSVLCLLMRRTFLSRQRWMKTSITLSTSRQWKRFSIAAFVTKGGY